MKIDDAFLYKYMPAADAILLAEEVPPDEELDHEFSRRFRRKMKALLKYERRTPRERKFYYGMKIAFAALAVILLVAFSSVMSVKAYRCRIIEFFVEVFEDLTSYSAQEENPTGEIADLMEPKYVPDGFEVIEREEGNQGYTVRYENKTGEKIYYRQTVVSATQQYWDTETGTTQKIYIGKQEVGIIKEENTITVCWNDDNYMYKIMWIDCADVDELLAMVRSVSRK